MSTASMHKSIHLLLFSQWDTVYATDYIRVCMCVCEWERERHWKRVYTLICIMTSMIHLRKQETERMWVCVCVHVCVCACVCVHVCVCVRVRVVCVYMRVRERVRDWLGKIIREVILIISTIEIWDTWGKWIEIVKKEKETSNLWLYCNERKETETNTR